MSQVTDQNRVASWFDACVQQRGWRIAQVESRSGVKRRTIDRLKSGEITPQRGTVHRLADAFGVSRKLVDDYLDGLTDQMPLPPPPLTTHGALTRLGEAQTWIAFLTVGMGLDEVTAGRLYERIKVPLADAVLELMREQEKSAALPTKKTQGAA